MLRPIPGMSLLMLRPIPGMSMSRFIQLHLDGASGLDRATTPTQLHLDGALLGRPLDSRPPYGFLSPPCAGGRGAAATLRVPTGPLVSGLGLVP